jgi:hypothetical protein
MIFYHEKTHHEKTINDYNIDCKMWYNEMQC